MTQTAHRSPPPAPASTSRSASSPTSGAEVAAPQLLPLGTARRRLLPDHRQARTRRRRQRLPAHPARTSATNSTSQHHAAPSSSTRHDAPVLLISAGIGATPVLAMLQALAKEHSEREIWWLHGARSSRDHSFAAEARTLLASLPKVRTHVCYSRPGPSDREGRDFDTRRPAHRIAARRARAAARCPGVPLRPDTIHGRDQRRAGGDRVDASRIHTEPFGPAPGLTPGIAATPARTPHPPAGQPGSGPTIEFARSNLAVPVEQRLHQPARTRRSLRRARPMVVPHRRLPQLRDHPHRRRPRIQP